MPLECYCGDEGYFDWSWYPPEDYTVLNTKRRQRCKSCKKLIDVGATVIKFDRFKLDEFGEEHSLAFWYYCEVCADLFFTFDELGYCLYLPENMHHLLREYQDMVKANEKIIAEHREAKGRAET